MGSNPTLSALILIVAIFLLPNIYKAEKYKTEEWLHLSAFDYRIGYPFSCLKILSFTFGFSSPIPFGVGSTILEWGYLEDMSQRKSSSWGSMFPIHFYYTPYINFSRKRNLAIISSVMYFFCEFSAWAFDARIIEEFPVRSDIYYKMGMGINYNLLFVGLSLQLGFMSHIDMDDFTYYPRDKIKNLFFGVGLSIPSHLVAIGLKK